MVKRDGKKKKKYLVRVLLVILCISIIHTMLTHFVVTLKANKMLKYFKNKDVDGLLSMFCKDIKENYAEQTRKEIEHAFEFIEGDVVSSKYDNEGGIEYTKVDYRVIFYSFRPHCLIETDVGEKYRITFQYYYIWKVRPEYEGVCHIRIVNYKGDDINSGEKVNIGMYPDTDEKWDKTE